MSSIRTAGPEDLDTVTTLLIGFRDWWNSTSPTDETFRATAERLLQDPNTEFLLAGDEGFAQLRYRLSAWTGTEDCWLEDVFVRDSARGTGLGKALVQTAIDRARARGCKRIELDVNETNTGAIGLYEHLGFKLEPKAPGRTFFMGAKL